MYLKLFCAAIVGSSLVFGAAVGISTSTSAKVVCKRTMPDCDDKTGVAKRNCQAARAQNEANCQQLGKGGRKRGKGPKWRKCSGYGVDSASPTSMDDCE